MAKAATKAETANSALVVISLSPEVGELALAFPLLKGLLNAPPFVDSPVGEAVGTGRESGAKGSVIVGVGVGGTLTGAGVGKVPTCSATIVPSTLP